MLAGQWVVLLSGLNGYIDNERLPFQPTDNINLSTPTRFDKVGLRKEGFHLFKGFD